MWNTKLVLADYRAIALVLSLLKLLQVFVFFDRLIQKNRKKKLRGCVEIYTSATQVLSGNKKEKNEKKLI